MKYDKINFTKFRDAGIKRCTKFSRMRSSVVKYFGKYWFKDLGTEDLIKDSSEVYHLKTGVHNEDQLAEFMAKEQSYRERLGTY